MSVLFTDSGTGSDANPIGGSYVTLTGIGGLRRVSNKIANAAGSDTDSAAYINITTPNDQYCFGTPSTVGGRDGGPMVRCQTNAASGMLITDYNGTDVEAYALVAGSFGSFVDRDTGTYQTTSVVRFQAVGTTYTSKIDSTTINSFTDATFSSGKAGFFMYDATQRWGTIEVGDFVTGYTVALAQGSYTLTGQAVGFKAARVVSLTSGTYSLTGQATGMAMNHPIAIAQGSYIETGQAVGLRIDRRLSLSAGSYTNTGQAVGLKHGSNVSMAQGSYALMGLAVGLTYSGAAADVITIGMGSYNQTGSDAAADYAMNVASGSYALTGNAVGLAYGRKVAMAQGAYALNGQALGIRVARTMSMGSGSYAKTGNDVGLTQHAPAPRLNLVSGMYHLDGMQVTLLYSGMQGGIFGNIPFGWWYKQG